MFHTKTYTGSNLERKGDFTRRLEQTRKVENYLNSIMTEEMQTRTVHDIASAIDMNDEDVRKVLTRNGHGYNGITF